MHELLRGVRIIDMTTVVLGPYATQILGDLGAEVIKVEPPAGDLFRSVRPGRSDEMGAGFLNCNRNKKSLVLDLRKPEGIVALRKLVSTADAFVHNMRPKSARKLGIDYESIRAVNPGIVYGYAAGFGHEGPLANEPAYDDTIQAVSGFADLNANSDGEPRFLQTIVADKIAGLHLAIAVLAGLASRARSGLGACIEAPMFESLVSFLMVEQIGGMTFRPPLGGTGYDRLRSPYRKPFRTRDGFISIIPYNSAHWIAFLKLIGREDLVDDDRVIDPVQRSGNIDMLYGLIDAAAPERTTQEWIELLRARDIPCGEVNRIEDLFTNAHLAAVGMFRTVEHPEEGPLLAVRSPFRVLGAEERPDAPAPRPGDDGEAVLREAGFSEAEIAALANAGALGRRPATEKNA